MFLMDIPFLSRPTDMVDTYLYFKLDRQEVIKKISCMTDYSIQLFFLIHSRIFVSFVFTVEQVQHEPIILKHTRAS